MHYHRLYIAKLSSFLVVQLSLVFLDNDDIGLDSCWFRTAVKCLEEGGSPNTVSSDGATAMHIAAGVGVEAVRLMLAFGGNPTVR